MSESTRSQNLGDGPKSRDWLPDGIQRTAYLNAGEEWPSLEERIGEPRILKHPFVSDIIAWVSSEFKDKPERLSFFEGGCGHGNDLRAFKDAIGGKGRFLGLDFSAAEITRGIEYYREHAGEDPANARNMFAVGDLRDLRNIRMWDAESGNFSREVGIGDGEFAVVYMEAVLHGLGYGHATYREKKEAGQLCLNELHRICRPGGKFFGRAQTFDPAIPAEDRLAFMRETQNWRLRPAADEFVEMLSAAGFTSIRTEMRKHERADSDPLQRHKVHVSFLAEN